MSGHHPWPPPSSESAEEVADILREFTRLLAGPTGDGQSKRRNGKPLWKVDPDHEEAMRRHLHRYDRGETVDPDSGAHPLVHVAWRALALAWQETQGVSDDRELTALP